MQPVNRPPLLILIGASVRAAAQSAARCGIETWGADLFADRDAAPRGTVRAVTRYPQELFAAAQHAPAGPWMYTGGLENCPRRVEILSRTRPLAGCDHHVLRRARSLARWQPLAEQCGLAVPETLPAPPADPRGYLRKHRRSTGGLGVEPAGGAGDAAKRAGFCWQRRIDGRPASALYVSNRLDAHLLGCLWQWCGDQATGPYRYCGSVGPAELPSPWPDRLREFGRRATAALELTGIWGLDLVWDGSRPHVLEINPRWTAGAEIVERVLGEPLVGAHLDAALHGVLPPPAASPPTGVHGKRIVMADRSCRVSLALQRLLDKWAGSSPLLAADLPRPGQSFHRGQPICTVFAAEPELADVEQQLELRRAKVLRAVEAA